LKRWLAVAALIGMSVACSDGGGSYGKDDEKRVVGVCVAAGETRSVCQCIYDKIVTTVPYDDYVAQDERRRKDPSFLLPAIEKIAVDCAAKAAAGS
jgi:hypothetical protein